MERVPPKTNKPKKGRPSKYRPEFAKQAYNLCLLNSGATDEDLCRFFEVGVVTLNQWKKDYPTFTEALKSGKEKADAELGQRLYQRARGYFHPEEKIFIVEGEVVRVQTTKHYPPDTTALIFWLKNRRPDLWRDVNRHEVTGKDGVPLFDLSKLSDHDLAELESLITKTAASDHGPAAVSGGNPERKNKTVH